MCVCVCVCISRGRSIPNHVNFGLRKMFQNLNSYVPQKLCIQLRNSGNNTYLKLIQTPEIQRFLLFLLPVTSYLSFSPKARCRDVQTLRVSSLLLVLHIVPRNYQETEWKIKLRTCKVENCLCLQNVSFEFV